MTRKNNSRRSNNANASKKATPRKPKSKSSQKGASKAVFEIPAIRTITQAPRKKRERMSGVMPKMSLCGLKFLSAIAMPFASESIGACIPDNTAQPSQKVMGFVRFDITASSATIFITLTPSLANDMPSIFVYQTGTTHPTYYIPLTAVNTPAASAATGFASTHTFSNLPYTAADLTTNDSSGNPSVMGRVVSAGIRCSYTGATLNQSGLRYAYTSPRHDNVGVLPGYTGGTTSAAIAAMQAARISPFTRDYMEVAVHPINDSERQYSSVVTNGSTGICYPLSVGSSIPVSTTATSTISFASIQVGSPVSVLMITGVTVGSSIHIEGVIHAEYSGVLADPRATPNSAHAEDLSVCSTIVENMPRLQAAKPQASTWEILKVGASMAAKTALRHAVPLAEKALMALLI